MNNEQPAIRGFLSFIVTPYIAGSVIPSNAVSPADPANCFKSLFLVFKETHKTAPPWAILDTSMPGPKTFSDPFNAKSLNDNGKNA